MALAGIILGWVGVATLLLAIIIGAYAWNNDEHPTSSESEAADVLLENLS